jgi:indole-3-glycerol phosphate synthase
MPLLRKDFIIDERQILEAIEWGADAILLIVAILTDEQLAKFHSLATEAGLAALVEVHDEAELERALKISPRAHRREQPQPENFQGGFGHDRTAGGKLNRRTGIALVSNLKNKNGDRRDACPALLVAESGIHTRADVERLKKCGAHAILVGESLMRGGDIRAKIRELIG